MTKNSEVIGVIETDGNPIPLKDMSYFFYHFRAVYVESVNTIKIEETPLDEKDYIDYWSEVVANKLSSQGHLSISRNALAKLSPENEIYFTDISRVNPVSIVFECVGVALAVAVVISGGEVKFDENGFSAKLPPLGKGIAELKKAIQGNFKSTSAEDSESENKGE